MVATSRRAAAHLISLIRLSALGLPVLGASFLVGCGVEGADAGTGGVNDSNQGECPSGTTILLSDWFSTQVALSSLEGETLSASFISTASTEASSSTVALSGDVALPSSPPPSKRIVLIDRQNAILTWVDPSSAEVLAQLSMDPTGFGSNPRDYLEVGDDKAFVTRWNHNASPSSDEYDEGSDVLVVDTKNLEILGRIALPMTEDVPPRPSSMLRVGDEVIVSLDRTDAEWTTHEAELIGLSIEDEQIIWRHTLSGFRNCGRVIPTPDAKHLAVACSGEFDEDGVVDGNTSSALLLFDINDRPLREVARFEAKDIAGEPIQGHVGFASARLALLATQTPWEGETHNRWLAFDLDSGETTELLEASPDDKGKGKGVVYSRTSCVPGCSDVCLMADSDAGVLQRVRLLEDGSLELLDPIQVESAVGMPPRGIGLR